MRTRLLSFSLLTLIGCGPAQHSSLPADGGFGKTKVELNSFAALSKNIFEPKCAKCHHGDHPAGGVNLSSFEKIMASKGLVTPGRPDLSDIYLDTESGYMPENAPTLSDDEVNAIREWVLAGAPNGEFTVPPKFKDVQTKLFNDYCVKCHQPPKPKKNIDLTSFAKIMAIKGLVVPGQSANSGLVRIIEAGKMPPTKTGLVVPKDVLDTLKDWIDAGALNN